MIQLPQAHALLFGDPLSTPQVTNLPPGGRGLYAWPFLDHRV